MFIGTLGLKYSHSNSGYSFIRVPPDLQIAMTVLVIFGVVNYREIAANLRSDSLFGGGYNSWRRTSRPPPWGPGGALRHNLKLSTECSVKKSLRRASARTVHADNYRHGDGESKPRTSFSEIDPLTHTTHDALSLAKCSLKTMEIDRHGCFYGGFLGVNFFSA